MTTPDFSFCAFRETLITTLAAACDPWRVAGVSSSVVAVTKGEVSLVLNVAEAFVEVFHTRNAALVIRRRCASVTAQLGLPLDGVSFIQVMDDLLPLVRLTATLPPNLPLITQPFLPARSLVLTVRTPLPVYVHPSHIAAWGGDLATIWEHAIINMRVRAEFMPPAIAPRLGVPTVTLRNDDGYTPGTLLFPDLIASWLPTHKQLLVALPPSDPLRVCPRCAEAPMLLSPFAYRVPSIFVLADGALTAAVLTI